MKILNETKLQDLLIVKKENYFETGNYNPQDFDDQFHEEVTRSRMKKLN